MSLPADAEEHYAAARHSLPLSRRERDYGLDAPTRREAEEDES